MKEKETDKSLFRRYLDDIYTQEEARTLLSRLKDDTLDETLDDLTADVWEESAMQELTTDVEREKYKKEAGRLLKRIEHRKRTLFRRMAVVVSGVAAIFCLVFGSISFFHYIDERQVVYLEATTSHGERRQVQLPDGTRVTLNACSRLRYPDSFTGDERRIELEGEGYFRVERNEKQPFIINTRRFDVRVLGTCFDVKAYSSDEVVSVDVESGKVQVDLPEAMMRLQAEEQILINTLSGEYSKKRGERAVAVWRKGSLRFSSTPIRDVAKELERMYNCHITFARDEEFNNLISGEHDNKSLEAVLQSIGYTSGIKYQKEGNSILLFK